MPTQAFNTNPYTVDLNNLAREYEQRKYDLSEEAGDFHSEELPPPLPPKAIGDVATGWLRPGADAMRMFPREDN